MSALFGPHTGFIVASYTVAIFLIGGLAALTIREHKIMSRKLAQIDPRQIGPDPAAEKILSASTPEILP